MSTMISMEWSGMTTDQYNQVMRTLDLDKNPPQGAIFHVASFNAGTLFVTDIWESQQAFERFQKDRLNAVVQKVGFTNQPKIRFSPVYNIYVANMDTIRKTGSTSLPSAA
jgi:hypothetical protein